MRTTLPIGTLPGPGGPAAVTEPSTSIEESLRRYIAQLCPSHRPAPTCDPGRPPRLPELGTTREDLPRHKQRRSAKK